MRDFFLFIIIASVFTAIGFTAGQLQGKKECQDEIRAIEYQRDQVSKIMRECQVKLMEIEALKPKGISE